MEVIGLEPREAINIEGLSYRYPDGTPALENINLTVRRGESVAVMGPNGAGKSTLALHLNGILSGEGRIEIMGLEVSRKDLARIRSMVGLVFQDPDDQLFCPTVREDVAFGPRNQKLAPELVAQAVSRALGWVGMEGSEGRSPHHMSFGEKKRISLATVLSMEPEILVLDEPVTNLDPKGRRELIELVKGFEVTRIVISHDIGMTRELCDRLVIIDGGKIVADGNTAELLGDGRLLERHGLL
ncbi:MAG: energy-coupling factor ABC transporter ATP-binding protein [Actinomycetia bacterium]|nr:energy-coupling factor ABC transporter ATP-binding protein [Actinomycetes bacterium]